MNNLQEKDFSIEKADREQLLEGLKNIYKHSGFEVKNFDDSGKFSIVSKEGNEAKVEFKWHDNSEERLKLDNIGEATRGHHYVSNAFFDPATVDAAKLNAVTLVDRASLETAIKSLPEDLIPTAKPKTDIFAAKKGGEKEDKPGLFGQIEPKEKKQDAFAADTPKAETTETKEVVFGDDKTPAVAEEATTGTTDEQKDIFAASGPQPIKEDAKAKKLAAKKAKKEAKAKAKTKTKKEPKVKKAKTEKKPKSKLAKIFIPLLLVLVLLPIVIAAAAIIPNIGKIKNSISSSKKVASEVTRQKSVAGSKFKSPTPANTNSNRAKNQLNASGSKPKAPSVATKPTNAGINVNRATPTTGSTPKTTGSTPKNAGSKPKSTGSTPKPLVSSTDKGSASKETGSKPKELAASNTGSAHKATTGSAPKNTGSKPKTILASTNKGSSAKPAILGNGSQPKPAAKGSTPKTVTPVTALFESHIKSSSTLTNKKDYWSTMGAGSWQRLETETNKALESTKLPQTEWQQIKSYMAVAHYLRGNLEEMTVQLIELESQVSPTAVTQLGLTQNEFLNKVGKIVGANNVKLGK